jgi:putative DNA primase/helicase
LVGKGRNGKSVISGAISAMFGDRLVSCFSPQELLKDNDRRANLASLVGKIANFSDDVRATDYSGGGLKQFVSGHKMSARKLYGSPFVLDKLPYLLCCVNEIPPTKDDTLGHFRRFLSIKCPNVVAREDVDPQLGSKLSEEGVKAAIFNWVYEGYKKFVDAGGKIVLSERMLKDMEDCRADSNSVRRWIRDTGLVPSDRMGKDSPDWEPFAELMNSYRKWCKLMGEHEETGSKVGRILSDLDFPHKRKQSGGINITYYCCAIGAVLEEINNKEEKGLPF